MAEGIIIGLDIRTPKAVKAIQDLNKGSGKLERKIDQLTGAVNAQANAVSRLARGYGQVATNAQRAANASKRVRAPGRFSSFGITDPDGTIKRYGPAAQQGDAAAQRWVLAAQAAKNRQRRVSNIVNPPDPFLQAMMRTRFAKGIMGRVGMPLGVDIAKFAGDPDKMAALMGKGSVNMSKFVGLVGKAGPIIGGALLVVGSAVTVTMAAMRNAQAQRTNMARYGGTASQAKSAAMIGRVTGTDPSSVMANVGSGGLAGAVAMKYGVSPVRGYYGEINDARDYARLARAIGKLPYHQARRESIALGAPEMVNMSLLDNSTRERLIKARTSMGSTANMKAQAEFQANMEIAKASFSEIVNILGSPTMRSAAMAIKTVVEGIGVSVALLERAVKPIHMIAEEAARQVENVKRSPAGKAVDWFNDQINDLYPGSNKAAEEKKNVKKMGEAVDKFDRVVQGMSGGGPRAGGAVPDAYRNKPIDEDRRAEYQRKLRMGQL